MSLSKFYQKEEFLVLQREWQVKLEATGFIDIERGRDDTMYSGSPDLRKSFTEIRGSLEYYAFASKFLWDFTFESERERNVWAQYAEGVPRRTMVGDNRTFIDKTLKRVKPIFFNYIKAQLEFNEPEENEENRDN